MYKLVFSKEIMIMNITIKDIFEIPTDFHPELFQDLIYPWEVVAKIADYIQPLVKDAPENIVIGKGTVVEEGVVIKGPAIIGENCQIRSGAYIRGNVIIGNNVVIGHASEIKNAFIMDGAHVSHFNYVGDSIVGNKAHFAAGSIAANTKLAPGEVVVRADGKEYNTGLRKFGCAVGDGAEIGCNAVLNPGSIIGKSSVIYPLVSWRGVLKENMIAKSASDIVERK